MHCDTGKGGRTGGHFIRVLFFRPHASTACLRMHACLRDHIRPHISPLSRKSVAEWNFQSFITNLNRRVNMANQVKFQLNFLEIRFPISYPLVITI